ncbi:MAG: hypothetical protein U0X73_03795 [Thermoanaerobaculia bacterium]
MAKSSRPVTYTSAEIRGFLPSGWGIVGEAAGRWNAAEGVWSLEIYDGADNTWTLRVEGHAASGQRLPALAAAVDRVVRKGLGKKSFLTG